MLFHTSENFLEYQIKELDRDNRFSDLILDVFQLIGDSIGDHCLHWLSNTNRHGL